MSFKLIDLVKAMDACSIRPNTQRRIVQALEVRPMPSKDDYTDRKFAFMDDEGNIRLVQAKSMTLAKANQQETLRVMKQLLAGERKIVHVVSCRNWSGKFSD